MHPVALRKSPSRPKFCFLTLSFEFPQSGVDGGHGTQGGHCSAKEDPGTRIRGERDPQFWECHPHIEGEDERVLRAVQVVMDERLARPILIGRPAVIAARIARAAR